MYIKKRGNQTVIYLGDSNHEGIDITVNKGKRTLSIGGWYDSFAGIEGEEISLDFINSLFEKGKAQHG